MDYQEKEKQVLGMLKRTDFKNLSKNDVLHIASKLGELRPEVAKEVINQFPELAALIRGTMKEYRDTLGQILSSDDESLRQVYAIAEKDLDASADSRKQFFDFAEKIYADLNKCLDKSDISEEERENICAREIELFRILSEKDTEIRGHDAEIVKMVDKKDSEKRKFNWGVLQVASTVVLVGIGITTGILGGTFNLKLPKR